MRKLLSSIERPCLSERGVTMVEYGVLIAIVAVVVMAGATAFGASFSSAFSYLASKL